MRKLLILVLLLAAIPVANAAEINWNDSDVERHIDATLSEMTLEENIDQIAGVDFMYLRGIERLGIPRVAMADGPMGVRNDGPATAFGGGIAEPGDFDVLVGRSSRAIELRGTVTLSGEKQN